MLQTAGLYGVVVDRALGCGFLFLFLFFGRFFVPMGFSCSICVFDDYGWCALYSLFCFLYFFFFEYGEWLFVWYWD